MGSALNLVTELKLRISASKLEPNSGTNSNVNPDMLGLQAADLATLDSQPTQTKSLELSTPARKFRGKGKNKSSTGKKLSSKGNQRKSTSTASVSGLAASLAAPFSDQSVMVAAESVSLATLLADACPELNTLISLKGVGCAALAVFKDKCKKIVTWEVSHLYMKASQLKTAIQQQLLPNVTCIRMTNSDVTNSDEDAAKRLNVSRELCKLTSLTDYEVADGVMFQPYEWMLLPSTIHKLICHDFPISKMPHSLRLDNLACLSLRHSTYNLTCTQIHTILTCAVNLHELTESHGLDLRGGSFVEFTGPCNAMDIRGWVLMHQREKAGLKMCNVFVCINSPVIDEEDGVILNDALWALRNHPISFFTYGSLTNHHQEDHTSWYVPHVALVGTVFPGLKTLELHGILHDENMIALRCGAAMKQLLYHDLLLPQSMSLHFIEIIQGNPWLESIEILSSLGPAAPVDDSEWLSYDMKDDFVCPPEGWDVLRFQVEEWSIQRTPFVYQQPIYELHYLRKPDLNLWKTAVYPPPE